MVKLIENLNDCRPELSHLLEPTAPLRRCRDCEHDLGPALSAAFTCPMFGRDRRMLEVHCLAFEPKIREAA